MPLGFEHVTPVGGESHVGEVNRVCVLCENIAEARHALLPPVLIRVQEFEHVGFGKTSCDAAGWRMRVSGRGIVVKRQKYRRV